MPAFAAGPPAMLESAPADPNPAEPLPALAPALPPGPASLDDDEHATQQTRAIRDSDASGRRSNALRVDGMSVIEVGLRLRIIA